MNIWHQASTSFTRPRHALGLWISYAKLASKGRVPSRRDRVQLRHKRPFDIVFGGPQDDISLAANQSIELRYTLQSDFIAYSIQVSATTSSAASPGCRVGIKDLTTMPKKGKKFSNSVVNNVNFGGSGSKPRFLRKPYRFHAGRTIVVKIANMRNVTNNIQVVISGVWDE